MAVFACQSMEICFVWCVKLVFRQNHVSELADVETLNRNSFRPPTKALLLELSQYVDIDPTFSDSLSEVVERRHELIHRWGLDNGLPVDTDIQGNLRLWAFANELARDASTVSGVLLAYVREWLARFPEMQEVVQRLQDRTLPLSERFEQLRVEKA